MLGITALARKCSEVQKPRPKVREAGTQPTLQKSRKMRARPSSVPATSPSRKERLDATAPSNCNGANTTGSSKVVTKDFVTVLRHLNFDRYDKSSDEFKTSPNLDETVYLQPGECASFPSDEGFELKGVQYGRTVKIKVFDADGSEVPEEDTNGVKRKKRGKGYESRTKSIDKGMSGEFVAVELCARAPRVKKRTTPSPWVRSSLHHRARH